MTLKSATKFALKKHCVYSFFLSIHVHPTSILFLHPIRYNAAPEMSGI